ncbi:MAG: Uma2 family endonuclease [Acidobacteria bacterium]|nr:Uma2 family endonuclease [Acidobacteriota bacterium]
MSTTTRLITADELLAMPHRDAQGNDCRLSLIRGEIKTMSPTGVTHGILCAKLATELSIFVRENRLGIICGAETGFVVERNPDTVVGADVAFLNREQLKHLDNREKFAPFAPDLAVEVLSPSNTVNEMDEKLAFYFAAGSRLVWIVNPKRRTVAVYRSTVEVRILSEQETLDGGEALPGFSYKLSELFADE